MSLLWRGSAALLVLLLAVAAVVVAKDGDRQLVQAFNAAFVRNKLDEIDISTIFAPLDCPVDAAVYPFPEPKEDAALDLVLRNGRLVCGIPHDAASSQFGTPACRVGAYYREHNPKRYSSDLTVEWKNYSSVAVMWDDLSNGDIDCASYAFLTIGGFAGTHRRNTEWQPSCSYTGGIWYIATQTNSGIRNMTQLQCEMTRRWKQGDFYELASASVEETQLWAQFPHAIVEQFQTVADTWFAHVGHPDSVLVASGPAPNVSNYNYFPAHFYTPAATFFRTEVEDQYKVRADEVDSLEPWQKGNENLAKLYEAALLALIQSGDYDNIFSNYPDEAGVSLLGSSQQGYLDCYMSGSMYPIPDFEFEWQSNSTNHTFFIAVSRSSSSPLLNTTTDPPKGPLHTLNFAVAAWISSQLFISPPLKLEYMFYDTDEDALDAVANGTAQATANNFWLATTYRGNASRDVFRPSCSSVAFETPLWCLSEAPFSRYWDLANKLYSSADCAGYSCKLGAVGALSQAVLRYRFPNITVELFSTTDDALWALRNSTSQVVAITPPLFSLVPPGVTMVQGFDSFQVFTTFFRKDYQSSCGDTELDAGKGEQCLYTDTTCTTNCTCRSGYHARNPVHNSCEKDTPITAIVLGTVLGSFAVVLILVVVGVVLAMLVLFPLLRKKYRREGMTNFRSRMFGHRW
eukprot:TRINITY_DN397_c0_g1_i5.p1 TRINITY_DN397_c0_g1~~TRINITY_DN397_c0_g1_i5.p1  ORF type:complete len:686 (-),score=131.50 TRINITY_DN397_c0_g1_i5:88-2145(-)